jgi:lipopolysaccharide export LptBFGC system permease protein LptF
MTELHGAIEIYGEALKNFSVDAPADTQVDVLGEKVTREELIKRFRRSKLEYGQRTSLPIASVVMAFVGMALGIMSPRTQRTWGIGFAAMLGLVVFVIYYSLFSIGFALADSGRLNVVVALWTPNVIVSVIAVYLIRKIVSEQWQSVSGGVQQALGGLFERFRRRRAA